MNLLTFKSLLNPELNPELNSRKQFIIELYRLKNKKNKKDLSQKNN